MKKRGNEHSDKATKPMNNETNERRKEARKQGKNKGKNKQTDERPKNTSTKGHKMNTCTRESMEE